MCPWLGLTKGWKPGDVRDVSESIAKAWQDVGIAIILPGGPAVVNGNPVVVKEKSAKAAEPEKPETHEPTVDELRADLDAMGVKYHHKAGAAKLAELLADAKAKAQA